MLPTWVRALMATEFSPSPGASPTRSSLRTWPAVVLRSSHAALPALELKFDEANGAVSYHWKADEQAFAMPVRVGTKDHWQIVQPTAEWKTMKTPLKRDEFQVATDLYYVNVTKQ